MPAAAKPPSPPRNARPRRARATPVVDTQLTAEQKRLIRVSFLRIEPALDLVAQLFFLKLFRLDPSLRKKFSGPVEIQARNSRPAPSSP